MNTNKKYLVTYRFMDGMQLSGEKSYNPFIRDQLDDYVEADSKELAVELAIDSIEHNIIENLNVFEKTINYDYELSRDETEKDLTVRKIDRYSDTKRKIEYYFDFQAEEIES